MNLLDLHEPLIFKFFGDFPEIHGHTICSEQLTTQNCTLASLIINIFIHISA